ncbi:MAG: hypothetical protein E7175_05355 [Erysipelotrichaceae bacterium]|nr:hypothetical protein [Erysipelotrichaceae bacterium]
MKLKNVLMISFLAIAGIFGASSAIVNNEVKETPVVEKAEAAKTETKLRLLCNTGSWWKNDGTSTTTWFAGINKDIVSSTESSFDFATALGKYDDEYRWNSVYPNGGTTQYYYQEFDLGSKQLQNITAAYFKRTVYTSNQLDLASGTPLTQIKNGTCNTVIITSGTALDTSSSNAKNYYRIRLFTSTSQSWSSGTGYSVANAYLYSNSYTAPSSVTSTPSGYSFSGWRIGSVGGSAYTTRTPTTDLDLYAVYSPINYELNRRYFLCLDDYSSWLNDKAKFAVYLYEPGDTGVLWLPLTQLGNSRHFYFDMPSSGSYNKLVWIRLDPNYNPSNLPTYDNAKGFWNQSQDIFKDGDKDFWAVSGAGGDSKIYGTWYTANEGNYGVFYENLSPTPSTMRYWFVFRNDGGFFSGDARFGLHAYNDSGENDFYFGTALKNSETAGGTHTFYYFDVPITATKLQPIRVSSGSYNAGRTFIWNWMTNSPGYLSVSDYPPSKMWICDYEGLADYKSNFTATANDTLNPAWTASAPVMAKVLEAYYTCSTSSLNGNRAASNLKTNFWDHPFGDGYNTTMLYDYTYADYHSHGDSYDGCSRSGTYQISVTDKWLSLSTAQGKYGAINHFNPMVILTNDENNLSTIIIIIAASVSLLSITALSILLVKKRKRVDN